jgi:hypothetical protein
MHAGFYVRRDIQFVHKEFKVTIDFRAVSSEENPHISS